MEGMMGAVQTDEQIAEMIATARDSPARLDGEQTATALRELQSYRAAFTPTKDAPTKPGWYWWKPPWVVVEVAQGTNGGYMFFWRDGDPVYEVSGEWCGPIPGMDFYSCNGSKSGCEAERFGGCIYHRVGRWKKMAALRERIRDEAQTGERFWN
jgi:hypothetical protein